jgi:hypothetical protein
VPDIGVDVSGVVARPSLVLRSEYIHMPRDSSTSSYDIAVDKNAIIVARDGTELACDV